jgi:hypothetical protein
LPSCSSGQAVKDKEHISLAGNCLQFCYSPQEDLTGSYIGDVKYTADSMVDNQGMPWVRLGMEYIAFLSLDIVGKDSLSMYYTLYPAKWHTSQGGLYPIISGVVSDPENNFGFGTNRSVSDYISSLRKRIYKLTNP